MTSGVREPVVAGDMYAGDPQQLRSDIDAMLADATVDMGSPKVLVVPHGSYESSGNTAAFGYGLLAAERGKISRVVVLSPSHHVAFEGVAIARNVAFRTPLGDVLVDHETTAEIQEIPGVTVSDRPHQREFGIEVQLPFLQRMIGRVQIVPLVVGDIGASSLANLLEVLWGGPETLIVVSVDLSRGLDHVTAAKKDAETAASIMDLDVEGIDASSTCGTHLLRGVMTLARRRGMTTSLLGTSTSADMSGVETDVVGFGSFGMWESPLVHMDEPDVAHLLALAESTAVTTLLGAEVQGAIPNRLPKSLAVRRAAFVSVFVNGELRGSAGSLEAGATLAGAIVKNSVRAVNDERLGPVHLSERASMQLGVTVLGPLERIRPTSQEDLARQLVPGVDGLLARHGKNRATFLPAVWASIGDPLQFVQDLWERARIEPDVPVSDVILHRYRGQHYGAE